jgi:DNA modification methylase
MNEAESTQKGLLNNNTILNNSTNFVIEDKEEKQKYLCDEIRNKVILGDAFKVIRKIDNESVDMIFIDPPYFLQLPNKELRRWTVKTVVEGVNDVWDKFSSFEEYDNFIRKLLTEVKRVMKPKATIWVIATYHSIFRIGKIMQDLGYWILNDVIWVKTNPMPNWLGVRFTNATENLIWAVKDKNAKDFTFNGDIAKIFGIDKVGTDIWVIPICMGKERMRNEKGKKLHSTQKPIELLKRVILTSTKEGDLVLDPLAGTGTTGYVAQSLRRNFITIEINPRYVRTIEERFMKSSMIKVAPKVSQKRIREYMRLEAY